MEGILYYRKKHFCGYSNEAVDVIKDTDVISSILLGLKNISPNLHNLSKKDRERYVDRFKQKKLYLVVEGKTFLVRND